MTFKTLSVTEEAYNLLNMMKFQDESFTEAIIRLAKRRSLTDCAGLCENIPFKRRLQVQTNTLK